MWWGGGMGAGRRLRPERGLRAAYHPCKAHLELNDVRVPQLRVVLNLAFRVLVNSPALQELCGAAAGEGGV
jgi:hypothetical protein